MSVIEAPIFSACPFPVLIVQGDKSSFQIAGGSLFPSPPDSTSKSQVDFYSNAPIGWSVCPLGYGVYRFSASSKPDIGVVIFGLKVENLSTKRGKEPKRSIKVSKKEIEDFVMKQIDSINKAEEIFNNIIRSGVHETRSLNRDLYNAAYSLRVDLEAGNPITNIQLDFVKNIEALSETLRVRSDVFDLVSNPTLTLGSLKNFRIYKLFDRMNRSLTPTATSKHVQLKIGGNSVGKARCIAQFEVVPYVLLQNAIKYAPNHTYVSTIIQEDERYISLEISSFGPHLQEEEMDRVFEPGFRGELASTLESQGSGFGLSFVKAIIDLHENYSLNFEQDAGGRKYRGADYKITRVNLKIGRIE